jgi:hypothetical protein
MFELTRCFNYHFFKKVGKMSVATKGCELLKNNVPTNAAKRSAGPGAQRFVIDQALQKRVVSANASSS